MQFAFQTFQCNIPSYRTRFCCLIFDFDLTLKAYCKVKWNGPGLFHHGQVLDFDSHEILVLHTVWTHAGERGAAEQC